MFCFRERSPCRSLRNRDQVGPFVTCWRADGHERTGLSDPPDVPSDSIERINGFEKV